METSFVEISKITAAFAVWSLESALYLIIKDYQES
jgi:hypothetical protein